MFALKRRMEEKALLVSLLLLFCLFCEGVILMVIKRLEKCDATGIDNKIG